MDIQQELAKHNIIPDPMKDQFFLKDEEIVKKIVGFANLKKSDVVLEVGAGTGSLTNEIAKKAGKVFAFEIDKRFKPFLSKLPKNVEVHFENAWKFIQLRGKFNMKKEYNKVVANPPYSFIEPFLHNLTFLEYDKVILIIPLKFLRKVGKNGIFGSFFRAKALLEIPKEKFYPVPKSNSCVIDLVKLPDPIKTKNLALFLRQYMYQHEGQLVKNSLMEGIIKYARLVYSKKVTKNEARGMIKEKEIDPNFLEKPPENSEIYKIVEQKFRKQAF